MLSLSEADKLLLDELQKDFPLTMKPFEDIGRKCSLSETEVISKTMSFISGDLIRELSPVIDHRKIGYKNTLTGVQCREESLESVVSRINSHPGVSHNYLREHKCNIWFTLSVKKEKSFEEEIEKILEGTGFTDYVNLPSVRIFKLNVMFPVSSRKYDIKNNIIPAGEEKDIDMSDFERRFIRELQKGFEITSEFWKKTARSLDLTEDEVIEKIRELKKQGIIRRISCIVRHKNIGYNASAMVCFKIPEDGIISAGRKIAEFNQVSHCYQREVSEKWEHPLFAMIHAENKDKSQQIIRSMADKIACSDYIVLYSLKEFKKERIKVFI